MLTCDSDFKIFYCAASILFAVVFLSTRLEYMYRNNTRSFKPLTRFTNHGIYEIKGVPCVGLFMLVKTLNQHLSKTIYHYSRFIITIFVNVHEQLLTTLEFNPT